SLSPISASLFSQRLVQSETARGRQVERAGLLKPISDPMSPTATTRDDISICHVPVVIFYVHYQGKAMVYIEHARDTLIGPITYEYLQQRIREGWKTDCGRVATGDH